MLMTAHDREWTGGFGDNKDAHNSGRVDVPHQNNNPSNWHEKNYRVNNHKQKEQPIKQLVRQAICTISCISV